VLHTVSLGVSMWIIDIVDNSLGSHFNSLV